MWYYVVNYLVNRYNEPRKLNDFKGRKARVILIPTMKPLSSENVEKSTVPADGE